MRREMMTFNELQQVCSVYREETDRSEDRYPCGTPNKTAECRRHRTGRRGANLLNSVTEVRWKPVDDLTIQSVTAGGACDGRHCWYNSKRSMTSLIVSERVYSHTHSKCLIHFTALYEIKPNNRRKMDHLRELGTTNSGDIAQLRASEKVFCVRVRTNEGNEIAMI